MSQLADIALANSNADLEMATKNAACPQQPMQYSYIGLFLDL